MSAHGFDPRAAAANGDRRGRVLVTGGLGYIGAHTCVALINAGYEVVVLDNLANSRMDVLDRIAQVAGRRPAFVRGDVRRQADLDHALSRSVDAVVHFAGLKAVADSVRDPLEYYDVNVAGTQALLRRMRAACVRRIVFSSSATVYGEPDVVPIPESHACRPQSPYGRSKRMVEQMLEDLHASDPRWAIAALRYFNPAGAHASGLLGEAPGGVPNNLMPYLSQVAAGARDCLHVFGDDYDTHDGTGVRDYVHVVDLADAHVGAVTMLMAGPGMETINIGTGTGYSVFDVVHAYEAECGHAVPCVIDPRRPGDIASYYADPAYALMRLRWRARRGLKEMCRDALRFESRRGASAPVSALREVAER